ncbi:semaphorin 5 [Paragonimus westermani]|uniref:Semaphorin 5 n=1 Tax=Paragonimus westermani TaxID=34504 RepID=A0A5J4P063_9TREM|nr:semaphorin 5 [Paragonimus westermani]
MFYRGFLCADLGSPTKVDEMVVYVVLPRRPLFARLRRNRRQNPQPWYTQKSLQSMWIKARRQCLRYSPLPGQCHPAPQCVLIDSLISRTFSKARFMRLMENRRNLIMPTTWSNLVVDWMPTTLKTDNNLILFTVDPDRQIISKWHHFKGETCLIEELRVLRTPPRTADTDGERVFRLELIRAGQAKEAFPETTLFIATTEHLFRLPVARCERLGHRYEFCEALHDPYCSWNKRHKRCEPLNLTTTVDDSMILFDSCPGLPHSEQRLLVHGGWGSWSPWSACTTSNDKTQLTGFITNTAGQMLTASLGDVPSRPLEIRGCDCRYRFCSSPYPFGKDANLCTGGPPIQLANCSVDGHWTEWSSWSACEPACVSSTTPDKHENSLSVRTRQRWCLNPAVAGNAGKPCAGQAKETVSCPTPKTICPAEQLPKPIWSEWSAWSDCSAACGGGRQIRWRQCGRREPGWRLQSQNQVSIKGISTVRLASADSDKVICLGNAYEERPCNENQCPADDASSSSKSNAVNQPWTDNKEADGMWSAWTDCSRPCGSGVRYRWRPKQSLTNAASITTSGEPHAANADRQEEVCNTNPCSAYGSTESTPWAAWSECLRFKGVQYDIRVRARENCLNCEMVQAQRCDTGQFVTLNEILAFYESSQAAGQNATGPRLYTMVHAISVVIAATLIGAALILIPYMIYLSRSSKRKRQREILERSSIWRKLVDGKQQMDSQNLPYIWFAETQNGKLRTVRKRSSVSIPKGSRGNKLKTIIDSAEWKRMKNPENNTTGTPNSNARTTGFPNVNLTRIQALHNDHRMAPEMITHTAPSYSVHDTVDSRWHGLSLRTLDPDEVKSRSHQRYSPIESNKIHRKLITPTYESKNNELEISWNKPVLPDNTVVFPDTREILPSVMSSEPGYKQPDENGVIYATSLVR